MAISKYKLIFTLYFLGFSLTVQADLITLGDLSRDTSSNIVKQGNEREWLMWTESNPFTDEELRVIFDTGSLNGWQLANYTDVLSLYSSAGFEVFDTTGGTNLTYNNVTYSGDDIIPGLSDTPSNVHFNKEFFNLFGDPTTEIWPNSTINQFVVFFGGENEELGLTHMIEHNNDQWDRLSFYSNYPTYNIDGLISLEWINEGNTYALALHRAAQVPEPSTSAILVIGIMGLASRRFKKQS